MQNLPLHSILVGYCGFRRKFIIDSAMYERILGELQARGLS